MAGKGRDPSVFYFGSTRRMGLLAFISLAGIGVLTVLLSQFASPPKTNASPDHSDNGFALNINCLETRVREGDDFQLGVQRQFTSDHFFPDMRVFWHTAAITADKADYEHLEALPQTSNVLESKSGKMKRTFHTSGDYFPEASETFKVWFTSADSPGQNEQCIITILDDDGVGIYDLEITSEPGLLPATSDGTGFDSGYRAGDSIEITARFTGPVAAISPDTRAPANYAGLYIQVGENRRLARTNGGNGADTLVFSYQVREDDLDADGISINDSRRGSPGLFFSEENGDWGLWPVNPATGHVRGIINPFFRGLEGDP